MLALRRPIFSLGQYCLNENGFWIKYSQYVPKIKSSSKTCQKCYNLQLALRKGITFGSSLLSILDDKVQQQCLQILQNCRQQSLFYKGARELLELLPLDSACKEFSTGTTLKDNTKLAFRILFQSFSLSKKPLIHNTKMKSTAVLNNWSILYNILSDNLRLWNQQLESSQFDFITRLQQWNRQQIPESSTTRTIFSRSEKVDPPVDSDLLNSSSNKCTAFTCLDLTSDNTIQTKNISRLNIVLEKKLQRSAKVLEIVGDRRIPRYHR